MKKSVIKERPVGTIFNWRNAKYKVERDEDFSCSRCVFRTACNHKSSIMAAINEMHCAYSTRNDNTPIHYVKVDEK